MSVSPPPGGPSGRVPIVLTRWNSLPSFVERWTKDWSRHGPGHADQAENLYQHDLGVVRLRRLYRNQLATLKALNDGDIDAAEQDVLDVQVLVDALEATLATKTRHLDATERSRSVRHHADVQAHHSGLEALNQALTTSQVVGEYV